MVSLDITASPNLGLMPLGYSPSQPNQPATLGGVSLETLKLNYGSPLYVLDKATLDAMASAYNQAFKRYSAPYRVLFAAKANINMGLCQWAAQAELGLDVVSGGELHTAVKAGFPLDRVLFNGNNKTPEELGLALKHGIGFISVDNVTELDRLAELALAMNTPTQIFLRITPGIECHTHDYIKTGHLDSKFGFDMSQLDTLVERITTQYKGILTLVGLHAHIGSQIFETRPYADLAELMITTYRHIQQTFGVTLTHLNMGGGLGIAYTSADDPIAVAPYADVIIDTLEAQAKQQDFPLPILFLEPGRSMVATAGVTLYEVGPIKTIPQLDKTYVTVDGGMGDNIRPALYQAVYTAVCANKAHEPHDFPVTLAGRYCESGDILINQWNAPRSITTGDTVIVFSTGAYNASMASNYNRVPRPAIAWVDNGKHQLLVERESWESVTALDRPLLP